MPTEDAMREEAGAPEEVVRREAPPGPLQLEPAVDEPPERQEPTSSDAALGLVLVGAFLYFVFVWPRLSDGAARWLVTSAVALAVPVAWVVVRKSDRLREKLKAQGKVLRRWSVVASDFLAFVAVVVGIVALAVWLRAEDQVLLLKLFAILYFSLLPALLYLQFSSRKTLTLWKEFVLNLHRLQIDEPANLPRPPTLSRFYRRWETARDAAFGGRPPAEVELALERANIYRQKFRDLFGAVPSVHTQGTFLSLRSVQKLQVVITTVLVTIGWVFVVQPETVFGSAVTPSDFRLANLPPIPRETFAFAFLGAYFYVLQMLVRRYFQGDLKATAYIHATMRIIVVILLAWTLDPLLAGSTSQAQRSALAFVIGVFPTIGWQALQQLLVRKPLGFVVSSIESEYRLSDLDGLNIWYESRLLEVGVEDMQNLATSDPVDLMLNTRIPVDRLVDWIDQALLYLRVTDEKDRETLRAYGIRSATDLLDVIAAEELGDEYASLLGGPAGPSRMRALAVGLRAERNLRYVRAWKTHEAGAEWVEAPEAAPAGATAEPPQEDEPPEAAPLPA